MLLSNDRIKLFFVHIPRTAGRYVKNLFISNNFKEINLTKSLFYKGIESIHLHDDLLKNFKEYNQNKKFTIIRNPLKRLQSILSTVSIHEKILNNEKELEEYISFKLPRFHMVNWIRPQYEFINNECKIWKFENGFGTNFLKWIKDEFDIFIEDKNVFYKKFNYDDHPKLKITETLINIANKLYKKDFELYERT